MGGRARLNFPYIKKIFEKSRFSLSGEGGGQAWLNFFYIKKKLFGLTRGGGGGGLGGSANVLTFRNIFF